MLYVTNDATSHPLMAFSTASGPGEYWHNGDDPGLNTLLGSPTAAPDGRVFLHAWGERPYGATYYGDRLATTWQAATPLDTGYSDPALYEDADGLRVISPGRWGTIAAFDAATGAERWSVATGFVTDADATIAPRTGNV